MRRGAKSWGGTQLAIRSDACDHMRVLSTKRVMEAAVAVANTEAGSGDRLGVTATRRVARSSLQTRGHATGHGRP